MNSSLLKTITEHHADSLQEINQQLNTNTQQLNVISLALPKLTEVEERRHKQQSSSLKSPISHIMTLPLSNLSKNVKLLSVEKG